MRKQRIISILLTLCMVFALLPTTALAAGADKFTDVSKDSWYYKEVNWVVEKGYYKGTSDTTFEPDTAMTRAMFVTVLARYAGAKLDSTKSSFTDVPTGEWYTGAVEWAAKNKIVEGRGNGIFDPNTAVTREEMCTILDRYLKATGETAKLTKTPAKITDLDTVSTYAKEAVENCVSYGVILGYPDGTFGPKLTATRAHVAALLYRLQLKVSGGGGGGTAPDDDVTVTDLTYDAVEAVVKAANDRMENYDGVPGADKDYKGKDVVSVSAITLKDTGDKTAAVSVDTTVTLTSDLVNDVVTEAAAEAYCIYDILLAEYNGADDTRAALKAEVKDVVLALIDAIGYEPAEELVTEIVEEVYAKVLALRGTDITEEAAKDTAADIAGSVYDKVAPTASDLRTSLREKMKNYNGDYAFDTITISDANMGELFSIDVSNGFIVNAADGFKNSSIDLPDGKREFVKTVAIALAKQMRASVADDELNEQDTWLNAVTMKGTLTATLEIKDAVTNDPAYDCTEVFELTATLTATDETETVMYMYNGQDNIKITVPETIRNGYDAKVAALWNKVVTYVMENPDQINEIRDEIQSYAVAPMALDDESDSISFNLEDIDVASYLTPDIALSLAQGNYNNMGDVVEKAMLENINPDMVDKAMADMGLDYDTETAVYDLTLANSSDAMKNIMKTEMVDAAVSAIQKVVAGTAYEEAMTDEIVDYLAKAAVDQVVVQKAEEMAEMEEYADQADALLTNAGEVFGAMVEEAKSTVYDSDHMSNLVQSVIDNNETVSEAVNQIQSNPKLMDALEAFNAVDTYEELCSVELDAILPLLTYTDRFDDNGDETLTKIVELLNKYALYVPADATVTIGEYTIENDEIVALRNATSIGAMREAVIDVIGSVGGLSINSFADGLDVTITAGAFAPYTINVTIDTGL